MPTPATLAATAPNPVDLLGPDRPNETLSHAPGPVDNHEVVHVGVGPDGTVRSVVVDQRLTVHGVGDFELVLPGPALDVTAPASASPQPGLRRGAVVWQGFSPGTKELVARVTLDPRIERSKLPFRITSQGRVVNATALPVALADGVADGAALGDLAARLRTDLAAGRAPIAGVDGIPTALPARSPVTTTTRQVAVNLQQSGDVRTRLTVTAALPDPAALPAQATLTDVETVMVQVLRVPQYQRYVGSPVPGPSEARFEVAPAKAAPRQAPAAKPEKAQPFAIAMALVAILCLGAAATGVWLRS